MKYIRSSLVTNVRQDVLCKQYRYASYTTKEINSYNLPKYSCVVQNIHNWSMQYGVLWFSLAYKNSLAGNFLARHLTITVISIS